MLILLTLGNAVMGLNQESKASSAADALSQSLVVTAKTRRDGDLVDLPMDQLVPGDIVNLQAGDLVPADARILTAATLEIDESALTGESVPTPKQVDAVAADAALGDRVDMAFMNTPGHPWLRRRSSSSRPAWTPRSATSAACSRRPRPRRRR